MTLPRARIVRWLRRGTFETVKTVVSDVVTAVAVSTIPYRDRPAPTSMPGPPQSQKR